MRCRYCGQEIPEGMLYCEACGHEVRIVPDYNPLDDMLTEQVKVSIGGNGDDDYLVYDDTTFQTRATSARGGTGRTGAGRTGRTNTGRTRTGNTGRMRTGSTRKGNTDRMRTGRRATGYMDGRGPVSREEKRRQAEKKKARLRKKRRKVLLILALIIAAIAGVCFFIYKNSYAGIVRAGYKAISTQEYGRAEECFKRAISKNSDKADAYAGLADAYVKQEDLNSAEALFTDAIAKHRKNADIYEACIKYYLKTDQSLKIPILLDDADESITEKLAEYVVDRPKYSLDSEETYDDVQQLTLTSDGMPMYYTTDGSDPTLQSQKYTEPIQIGEGETTVKAFAVNKDGVPSLMVEKIYVVEFPIEEAPAISPSTGQYEEATKIEIKVPDGYEAYYTTNGDDPTTASKKYTEPIDMPEGETLFKAVLVNASGRLSGITTRNYVLDKGE